MRRVSREGIKELMIAESVELFAYPDEGGRMTIGIGHLLTQLELDRGTLYLDGQFVDWRDGITLEQAEALMAQDLRSAEATVNAHVKVPLEDNQFDALCFFTFNVGVSAFVTSTLLKRLNDGQYEAVPGQMRKWIMVTKDGQKVPSKGLRNRREREIAIWNGGGDT